MCLVVSRLPQTCAPHLSRRFISRAASFPSKPPRRPYRSLLLCIAPAVLAIPAFALSEYESAQDSPLSSAFKIWTGNNSSAPSTPHENRIVSRPEMTHNTAAPGRPGTLTKEQEVKLKEFWAASLRVFGVAGQLTPAESKTSSEATPVAEDSALKKDDTSAATAEDSKKKKSIRGLLSRKKESDAKGDVTPPTNVSAAKNTPGAVALDDSDDKYGQTKEFREALASQTPAELRQAFWEMAKSDNPDALLLRFLRARKWDVDKALVMMVATMNWRAKEMDVAGVIRRSELGAIDEKDEGFMKQLRMGKSFLHGVDKEGRPICFIRVRLHRQADQDEKSLEKYTVYVMETARLMLRDPVDTAAVVFDMTGFSLANMDYAPVKFMIKCFEAHYPESLGICLVHKAPWVFQSIWTIIKGWLDPVVASKIKFTKTAEELEQFIPKSQIIKELGGDEDWEYIYTEPSPNEDDALKDTAALEKLQQEREKEVLAYEEATRLWISADGDVSEKAQSQRKEFAKKLEDGYWKMDKYLRGRTIYDRTGVIKPDGGLDFYPQKVTPPETSSDDID